MSERAEEILRRASARWEEGKKKEAEEERLRKEQEAERLRQSYLMRTGRKELKP